MTLKIIPKKRIRRNYGRSVKGNTTIIGNNIGWGAFPLRWWANDMGQKGYSLQDAMSLATIPGSIVHAMIEAQLTDQKWQDLIDFEYDPNDVDAAENSYLNFLTWWEENDFKPVAVEPQLIAEVDSGRRDGISSSYIYGTTPDLLAESKRGLALLDWKSGKIYPNTLVQLSAGQYAWEYNNPDKPITGGFHIARIPRNDETLSFHHSYWEKLPEEAFGAFKLALRLNDIEPILKKYL